MKEAADAEAAAKVATADIEAEMKAADTMVEFMDHMMPAAKAEKRMRLEEGHYEQQELELYGGCGDAASPHAGEAASTKEQNEEEEE